jgi:TonB family protein
MNNKNILLAAAALGLLSTSAFATTQAAHDQTIAALKFEAPVPATVVRPEGLPRRAEGTTVTLRMTIDESGRAHDIKVVSRSEDAVSKRVVAAVAQWRFTPARKNGVAVPAKVMLPIELVDRS